MLYHDAIIIGTGQAARPWRGDWWLQAGRSRSSFGTPRSPVPCEGRLLAIADGL